MKVAINSSGAQKMSSRSDKRKSSPVVKDPSLFKRESFKQVSVDQLINTSTKSTKKSSVDSFTFNVPSSQESLGLTARQIVDKINEKLGEEFPDAVISFAPEENTPERIARNIVSGVTALFSVYSGQNKDLEGDKIVDSFMSKVRGGVENGYQDAIKILSALGAMDQPGLGDELEKTMELVEKGLAEFESSMKPDKDKAKSLKDQT